MGWYITSQVTARKATSPIDSGNVPSAQPASPLVRQYMYRLVRSGYPVLRCSSRRAIVSKCTRQTISHRRSVLHQPNRQPDSSMPLLQHQAVKRGIPHANPGIWLLHAEAVPPHHADGSRLENAAARRVANNSPSPYRV
ncbi:hypothetical protein MANI_006775 [Metarhizium anisopliae]|nr:hypothetical protein MANI_006775 [Metarhizium anisopliae]